MTAVSVNGERGIAAVTKSLSLLGLEDFEENNKSHDGLNVTVAAYIRGGAAVRIYWCLNFQMKGYNDLWQLSFRTEINCYDMVSICKSTTKGFSGIPQN